MVLSLKRVLIAVHDLDQAVQDYRALGFNVAEGGGYPNHTLRNAIIYLGDGGTIELIERTGEHPSSDRIQFDPISPDSGEGLVGYGLRTDDIEAETIRLREKGIQVGEILSAEYTRLNGKPYQWRFMTVENGYTPFIFQPITTTRMRGKYDELTLSSHLNSVHGLQGVEADLDFGAIPFYADLVGLDRDTKPFVYADQATLKLGSDALVFRNQPGQAKAILTAVHLLARESVKQFALRDMKKTHDVRLRFFEEEMYHGTSPIDF
jgi:hypothetical protein